MAKYGDVFVDERYSPSLEPNLYGDSVLQPAVSFNDEYDGDVKAGLVKIYKDNRDESHDPQKPAGDFKHESAGNELIDLRLNNAFRKSKKIYKVAADSVPYNLGEQKLATAVKDNQEDWQYSGLACLCNEGMGKQLAETITIANIKKTVVDLRKELRKKHAKADVVIADVDTYAVMLEAAGEKYTPTMNENTLTTGRVGVWLGMTWYEGDLLDKSDAKYYDYADVLKTVDLTQISMIMYDHLTFHIANNLEVMRIVDSNDFVGSLAQNEINTGYRVANDKKVLVCKKPAANPAEE